MTILYQRRVDCALLALPLLVEVLRSKIAFPVLQVHFQLQLAHLYAQTVLLALPLWPVQHRVQPVWPASIPQRVVHALLVQLVSIKGR